MKFRRFKHGYRENASLLHQKVGEALTCNNSLFSSYRIYQEYPVKNIYPAYPNPKHHYDWVVLDLRLIIEAHGKQHFEPVDFGGEGFEVAVSSWYNTISNDKQKQQAAADAHFTYIMVPHTDIDLITDTYLWKLYQAEKHSML